MPVPPAPQAHPAVRGSIVAMRWSVVLPVKRTEVAKSRLDAVPAPLRRRLALAFAIDTLTAVVGCPDVALPVVVTDDPEAARQAGSLGALVVADRPGNGLNPALRYGAEQARRARPDAGVVLLSADLPALRTADLGRVLTHAAQHRGSFVADASGLGTTLLAASDGRPTPLFGRRSRARHRAAGLVELTLADVASVRRDVDDAVDLWDALRLGVGPATRAVLAAT
jgi:2-phospho-L-lactate guanylyltransferase